MFAPTDAAFGALGEDALRTLSDGPWLTSVLHRRMVPDLLPAADLTTGQVISDGGIVEVAVSGGRITYGDAEVTETDIETANGVIHVLTGVVQPDHIRSDIAADGG